MEPTRQRSRCPFAGNVSSVRILSTVRIVALLLLAAFAAPTSPGQSEPRPSIDPHHIDGSSLGNALDLSSTWLVRQGDDPRYADPHLDDSAWPAIQSGSPLASKGLKDVDFLWYRTHVRFSAQPRDLALVLRYFAGSYQLFANGVQVGGSRSPGQVGLPPGGSYITSSQTTFAIPASLLASGELTIAFRCRIGRVSEHGLISAGFTSGTVLLLGSAPLIAESSSLFYFRDFTSNVANLSFELLLLLIALALALTLRSEPEYLALVIYLASVSANDGFNLWRTAANIEYTDPLILLREVLNTLRPIAGIEFVRLVLGLPRTRLLAAYEWLLATFGLCVASVVLHVLFLSSTGTAGPFIIAFNSIAEVIFLPADAGLPLLALWVWWKRRNLDALLLFVPLLFSAAIGYAGFVIFLLYQLHIIGEPQFGRVPLQSLNVSWDEVTGFSFSMALLLFLILRTLRLARERADAANEIAAAQTVQQVLLARASQPTPGFTVESVYLPASEVGGDFFLVSPGPDGSLIAIVGDVSGKGLLAAMRVSMILGILRREDSRDPSQILNQLNEALLTQGEMGFTTACCVRLERTGQYTLSNAGHISPYVAGFEIQTPPGLPLGLAADQAYQPVVGTLGGREKLVLMSDGVVEARSTAGELYGFDRLPGLTRMPASDIAEIAQRFGQEDDITVLTIACAV